MKKSIFGCGHVHCMPRNGSEQPAHSESSLYTFCRELDKEENLMIILG